MRKSIIGLLALCLGGCVLGPTDGSEYPSRTSLISFVGYASQGSAEVVIECRRVSDGVWVGIGGDTANGYADNPGETTLLYNFYDQAQVHSSCWASQGEFGYRARVRVREPEAANVKQLYTFTQAGILCLNDELASGQEWVPAGSTCVTGTELTLYAAS